MKRTLYVILTLMLTTVCPVQADQIPALTIKTDVAEKTIALTEISKVNYTDTEMCITLRDGQMMTILMDSITSMKFTLTEEIAAGIALSPGNSKEVPQRIFLLDGTRAKGNEKNQILIIKAGKETRKVRP